MGLLDKIWGFVANLVPIERWVKSVENLLKYLSLAFILVFILLLALVLRDWGFSSGQRFTLATLLIALLLIALLIAMFLAIRRGDLLYSPFERSLRRGRNYGTESTPISKRELETLPPPAGSEPLQLPPNSEHQQ